MDFASFREQLSLIETFFLTERGYDSVRNLSISINSDGATLNTTLYDDFAKAEHSYGKYDTLYFSNDDGLSEIWEKLRKVPSRERREIEFLARRSGQAKAAEAAFVSLAGREFAAALAEAHTRYAGFLGTDI
jgi:hypothetical protein